VIELLPAKIDIGAEVMFKVERQFSTTHLVRLLGSKISSVWGLLIFSDSVKCS
jgi:hypothetical protein